MNIVYIVVKSRCGEDDYNVSAYTDEGKALERCKKERGDPSNKFYDYWVDRVNMNEE
jgi:hypothetical protein